MQYNKPFDQTDPNAPYQNGNPATGTDGSIPPAESIEFPQREIVNVIQWAFSKHYIDSQGVLCAAPTNLDLEQLRKAIQGMIRAEFPTDPNLTPIIVLKANAYSYINPTTGSDTAYDGSQATVSGTKGPFATIARGIAEMTKYNLNGFIYRIVCADGTYSQTSIALSLQNGSGVVALLGNDANPAACVITSTLGSCCVLGGAGSNYYISGFKFIAQGAPKTGDKNSCIWVLGASTINLGNIEYGTVANNASHLCAQNGGTFVYGGNSRITGSAARHLEATGGIITTGEPTTTNMTIANAVTFSGSYIQADTIGQVYLHYASLTGAGSVTGKTANIVENSVVKWGLSAGSAPPGTIAGTQATGGQYITF